MSRATIIIISLLGLLTWSCGDEEAPCAADGVIVPGAGVGSGGQTLCLGENAAAVQARLGSASSAQDMGAVGKRVEYAALKVTLLLGGVSGSETVKAIYLGTGSTLKTTGGVGLGSSEAEVKAALGAPVMDPFIGAYWYRDKGIVLQLEGGKVVSIQVTALAKKK